MIGVVPGWRMLRWRVYSTNGMVSQGFGDICEGDVVFRSGLKDGKWRLEKFTSSSPVFVQRF